MVSWNHGRAGEVMPAIMPAAPVWAAMVAVQSMISWSLRSPRLLSEVSHLGESGRVTAEISRQRFSWANLSDFNCTERI